MTGVIVEQTLKSRIELLLGDIDEPFNFKIVKYDALDKAFRAAGSPSVLPDLDPELAYMATEHFLSLMVKKLGLGLITRVVVIHNETTWRELYKITIFLDEINDTYVIQFFEQNSIFTIARISKKQIDWGYGFIEGSPQEVAFNGFIMGICRNVPLKKQEMVVNPQSGEFTSIN